MFFCYREDLSGQLVRRPTVKRKAHLGATKKMSFPIGFPRHVGHLHCIKEEDKQARVVARYNSLTSMYVVQLGMTRRDAEHNFIANKGPQQNVCTSNRQDTGFVEHTRSVDICSL